MMNTAAGLAVSGKIPFATTFAIFASGRAWEQIRNTIAYGNLNVKIVATHGGISVGPDGASHQGIEDMALMRAIPGMTVLVPTDANQVLPALQAAMEIEGRPPFPQSEPIVAVRIVSPNYFRAMGIPLLKGRCFSERDAKDAPRVAIIDETLASTPGLFSTVTEITWCIRDPPVP